MTQPHPEIVHRISNQMDDITDEQVQRVLAALNAVKGGDHVGTIRRNEKTGEVAHRVEELGTHLWRITHPDGSTYNDLQPTLPWTVIWPSET